jgi:hypothetical protein
MSPSRAIAIFLLTARPRPTPSLFNYRLLFILVNGLKRRESCRRDIPTPVSVTASSTMPFSELEEMDTVTEPC